MTVLSSSRPVPAPSGLIATISNIAKSFGVDANLAIATALTESGLNNNAVGDNGTSFGLFQLHQGGELGNLTSTQAFNPVTNATTALAEFQAVKAANPGNGYDGTSFSTPGDLAAAAQRPADRVGYASKVNYYYNQLAAGIPVQNIQTFNGQGQAIGSSTAAQLTADQVGNSSGGCNSKGPNGDGKVFSEGGFLGIGSFSFTYCNLKAITGTTCLLAGGAIMLVGAAMIVVIGLGSKSPVGKALTTVVGGKSGAPAQTAAKAPSPAEMSGSPSRRGSASSHAKPRSVTQEPDDSFTEENEKLPSRKAA